MGTNGGRDQVAMKLGELLREVEADNVLFRSGTLFRVINFLVALRAIITHSKSSRARVVCRLSKVEPHFSRHLDGEIGVSIIELRSRLATKGIQLTSYWALALRDHYWKYHLELHW